MFKKGVKTNLITLRERKSRYLIAIKKLNKEASGTALALINTITKIKNYIKSITFDQGSEFKKYEWIKNYIGADIYFCEPSSPYQKGAIENGNGNIRIEFQRDCNAENIRQRHIDRVIKSINNRPLKCLGYMMPTEEFHKYIFK